jgi:hypothetical protein
MQVADAHRDNLLRQAQPEYRLVKPNRQRCGILGSTVGLLRRRVRLDSGARFAPSAVCERAELP